MKGIIEINGVKSSRQFNWESIPGVRKILLGGIPGQKTNNKIRVTEDPIDFNYHHFSKSLLDIKIKSMRFYYGESGRYLQTPLPFSGFYAGKGIFIINGIMIEEIEKNENTETDG